MAAIRTAPWARTLDNPHYSAETCSTSSSSAGDTLFICNSTAVLNPQWLCSRWMYCLLPLKIYQIRRSNRVFSVVSRALKALCIICPRVLYIYNCSRHSFIPSRLMYTSVAPRQCGRTSPGITHGKGFAEGKTTAFRYLNVCPSGQNNP